MRLPVFFTLLLTLLLGTRGLAQDTGSEDERPLVVTSASIFADMTLMVAGELVRVRSVVPIGGDPHIYEPTPSDVRLVAAADLVLVNGLTFEGWMSELIENSGTRARTVRITEGIGTIDSEEYANSADPHAWMTALNGVTYVNNIRDALSELDPFNRRQYAFNANVYAGQLRDLDAEIFAAIATIPERQRVLITSHDAFRYFGRHYGIRVEAALGTSTDADVQTDDVDRLTRIIRETGVPAIFVESTINPKLIRQIAADNGVFVGGSLYADSLGEVDSQAGTYMGMLRYNVERIVRALRGDRSLAESEAEGSGGSAQTYILLAIILAVMAGSFFYMVGVLNRGVTT